VPAEQYDTVRENIAERLMQAVDEMTGDPLVKRVVKSEDYYYGEYLAEAPSLIIEFCEGYQYGGTLLTMNQAMESSTRAALSNATHLQGTHGLAGIIGAVGPNIAKGKRCSMIHMVDVAPTVLSLLDVGPPDDLDGGIASELFVNAPSPSQTVSSRPNEPHEPASSYSEEEEAEVRERLRGLGYID
jgi:predicted AlkP superfamily phosphohydrolase/phosphomutase